MMKWTKESKYKILVSSSLLIPKIIIKNYNIIY